LFSFLDFGSGLGKELFNSVLTQIEKKVVVVGMAVEGLVLFVAIAVGVQTDHSTQVAAVAAVLLPFLFSLPPHTPPLFPPSFISSALLSFVSFLPPMGHGWSVMQS
jgi:hypothetical protein